MRDSVLNNDVELDEKVEKIFDEVALTQQNNLEEFFAKVEERMNELDSTITATKTQVKSFEDKVTKHP